MSHVSSEIRALIALLDDPDRSVQDSVMERLEEIGKEIGITKEGVRQIEKKATRKLREKCLAI